MYFYVQRLIFLKIFFIIDFYSSSQSADTLSIKLFNLFDPQDVLKIKFLCPNILREMTCFIFFIFRALSFYRGINTHRNIQFYRLYRLILMLNTWISRLFWLNTVSKISIFLNITCNDFKNLLLFLIIKVSH